MFMGLSTSWSACPNTTTLFELDNSYQNTTAELYLLDVYGGTSSAAIHFAATAAAFGQEIRTISAIDFQGGKIAREIDYWNARNNSVTPLCPEHKVGYPKDLGLEKIEENASQKMRELAQKLSAAFSVGDAATAAAHFDYNAVFEDLTLRLAQEGRREIQDWLQLTLPIVPYGRGAALRHVLGSDNGGAYEWEQSSGPVVNGIVALAVGKLGTITALRTVWMRPVWLIGSLRPCS